jgi:hypothetical protein
MTGVLESRSDRTNQSVLSDSGHFFFAFLNEKPKLSKSYSWRDEKPTVISYIDTILQDAIESPTKSRNTTLLNYQRSLASRWTFGVEQDAEDGSIDPKTIVDINPGLALTPIF